MVAGSLPRLGEFMFFTGDGTGFVTEWNKARPVDQLWQVSSWADSAFFSEQCDEDLGIEGAYLFEGIQIFKERSWTNNEALSSERYLSHEVCV
jgi:hypothetical protein